MAACVLPGEVPVWLVCTRRGGSRWRCARHVRKEEEEEMFKEAKKLLSAAELKALGARMEQRKVELIEQLGGSQGKA